VTVVVGRLAAFAVACVVVASAAAGRPAVQFPRDHFAHPAASIEWWYFTALAHDNAGTPYSVFFTLFSSRGTLVPVAEVRNLKTGALVGHSERLALGRVGSSSVDVTTGGARLRYDARSDVWVFSASAPGFSVSLRQHPEKPYVLHGGSGLIRQSLAGVSHYYSATRMRAAGTLRTHGNRLGLSGESWFDHQWGSYRNDPRAFNWDWFSCRFDDDSELMLYQFRDRSTGLALKRLGNGTYVPRRGRPIEITNFRVQPGRLTLDAAGHRWPLDWQLRVPRLDLSENLRSLVPDQLVRNRLLPTFWEGAARATGGRTGTCFVELSYR
jgi:predicted secreted hydrolase